MALTKIGAGLFKDTLKSSVSGALGDNATTIRNLTSAGITGSFSPASASISTRLTTAESELSNTLISSSVLSSPSQGTIRLATNGVNTDVDSGLQTSDSVQFSSVQADGGVTVDNITIDGTEIDLSSGDLTVDVAGDIVLDADGADVILKDDGTEFGRFKRDSSDFVIKSATNNKDIIFKGQDGGATITALTLDMSESGNAIFNNDVTIAGTLTAQEIHTEFTSASIMFSSGSTKFGDTIDDIHEVTGSLNVSGSLTLNDGTLTVTDNVDFNGDLDVDGTTNLDVVDIDGAVDMASTLAIGGNITLSKTADNTSAKLQVQGDFNNTTIQGASGNAGGLIVLRNSDSTDNNFSAINFQDANENTLSGILGVNKSHSSNQGEIVFFVRGDLHTDGDEAMRITHGGKVGIGTNAPAVTLDVKGSALVGRDRDIGSYASDDFDLMVTNANNDATAILLYNDAGAYQSSLIEYYQNKLSLGLNNSNSDDDILTTTAINITSTGVGIGTATPVSGGLHIHTDASTEGIYLKSTGNTRNNLVFDSNISSAADNIAFIDANWNETNVARISMFTGTDTSNQDDGRIGFATAEAGTVAERMRIESDGKVGIGITNPADLLDIQGGNLRVRVGGAGAIHLQNDGSNHSQILANNNGGTTTVQLKTSGDSFLNGGHLGIGATPSNPGGMNKQLEITSTADVQIAMRATSDLSSDARIGELTWITSHGSNPQVASIQGRVANGDEDRGQLSFHTRNTDSGGAPPEKMRLTNTGFLGIGCTDPEAMLQVNTGVSNAAISAIAAGIALEFNGNPGGHVGLTVTDGTAGRSNNRGFIGFRGNASGGAGHSHIVFGTATGTGDAPTERMRIDVSGNVGIGEDAPTAGKLQVKVTGDGERALQLINGDSNQTSSDETMRISLSGDTSPTNPRLIGFEDGDSQMGGIVATSGTTVEYSTSSDYRLKENEQLITDGLERVKKLKPYKFNWKTLPDKIVDGFFAHEVAEVVPEAVVGEKDATKIHDRTEREIVDPQLLNVSRLVPILVASVQELSSQVNVLKAQISGSSDFTSLKTAVSGSN